MISVEEAISIIQQNVAPLPPVKLPLQEAAGKILAEDLVAAWDIPGYPQSSMDGYAFAFESWEKGVPLPVQGEIAAGNTGQKELRPGAAVRIFTGAPVPPGADTVVMQEKVTLLNGDVLVQDKLLQKGNNVRPKGSEIRKNDLAMHTGQALSPAAIGFIAGLGYPAVKVFAEPKITIIVTGNELQKPGEKLAYGQVFESNSYSLGAALKQAGIQHVKIHHAIDDMEALTSKLGQAMQESDLVLLTGGVSVGDYDFVLKAAENLGIITLFHKIRQRPGKPLFFAKKDQTLVFGLPGNPSSVLTCFYEYVLVALSVLTRRGLQLTKVRVPLEQQFSKTVPLSCFLKGTYDGNTVRILAAQESYKMNSFARANCFVHLPEGLQEYEGGKLVEIHLFPG